MDSCRSGCILERKHFFTILERQSSTSQLLLAGVPLYLKSTGPVRERSFGDVRFTARTHWCIMALTHACVLTSATPVGERFWNLKIGKSGFREATARPSGQCGSPPDL